jgi:hypothetical protein
VYHAVVLELGVMNIRGFSVTRFFGRLYQLIRYVVYLSVVDEYSRRMVLECKSVCVHDPVYM